MGLHEELIATERSLWTNRPDVYQATFTSEAILVFPETGKIGRSVAVDAIREENVAGRYWADVRLGDVAISQLAAEVVLLTYRATARWNYEDNPIDVLCSTVYLKKEGRWKVGFHQQTPV